MKKNNMHNLYFVLIDRWNVFFFYSCRYQPCFLLQASMGSHGESLDISRSFLQLCCADKHIDHEPKEQIISLLATLTCCVDCKIVILSVSLNLCCCLWSVCFRHYSVKRPLVFNSCVKSYSYTDRNLRTSHSQPYPIKTTGYKDITNAFGGSRVCRTDPGQCRTDMHHFCSVPCQSGCRRRHVLGPQVYTGWRVHDRSSCLWPPCCKVHSNIYPEGFCVFDQAECLPVWRDEWSSHGYLSQ